MYVYILFIYHMRLTVTIPKLINRCFVTKITNREHPLIKKYPANIVPIKEVYSSGNVLPPLTPSAGKKEIWLRDDEGKINRCLVMRNLLN